MLILNLYCQLVLRISAVRPLYLKKAGLAIRNIVHRQKNILRCVGFCLYILHFVNRYGPMGGRVEVSF